MEAPRFSWKQVVLSFLVAATATVVATLVVSWWQTREPELVFSSPETIPYVGTLRQVAVYQVTVSNRGRKAVAAVSCLVQLPGAHIEESHLTVDKAMKAVESMNQDGYRVELPELNPGETVVLSVLASTEGALPAKPNVFLRGSGTMGREESLYSSPKDTGLLQFSRSVLPAIAGVMTVFAYFLFFRSRLRRMTFSNISGGKHSDDQREIISYLCGLYGLQAEVERVLTLPRQASYWAESDRLAAKAVSNASPEESTKYKAVLEGLLQYASTTDLSAGIINYNLARIAAKLGNTKDAEQYLRVAKPKMGALFDTRLELDEVLRGVWASANQKN